MAGPEARAAAGDPQADAEHDRVRDEQAKAAGTGDAESTDIRVAGPPPTPVRRPGGQQAETERNEDEVATSFPRQPGPRHAEPDTVRMERLMNPQTAARLRDRWHQIQSGFVDDPRDTVRKADELAGQALDAVGESLREHKRSLDSGDQSDTEQLRQAVRRYRDFLDHMLSV